MSDAHDAALAAPAHAHDAHGDHPDIDSHVRTALIVFGCLILLTGMTVGASYLHLPHELAIVLALAIATIKGGLVVAWFMHLISERKLIHSVLALTVFFFFLLLMLPYWTNGDRPHLSGDGKQQEDAANAAPAPANPPAAEAAPHHPE